MMATPIRRGTAAQVGQPPSADEVTRAKLQQLNTRIDAAIQQNRHGEYTAMALSTLLFLVGLTLLVLGFLQRDFAAIGVGALLDTVVMWPIKNIIALRSQNIRLAVLPGMLDLLPPQEALQVWKQFYEKWLK
jgi:hypothetical protein